MNTTRTRIYVTDVQAGDSILGIDTTLTVVSAAPTTHDYGMGRGAENAVRVTWLDAPEPVTYSARVTMTLVSAQ